MSAANVTISSDSSTLRLNATPVNPADAAMQFSSGSFKGAVDERRVAFCILAIPVGGKLFSMRFEFTDPSLANVDLKGIPVYITAEERITPFSDNVREKEADHHVAG